MLDGGERESWTLCQRYIRQLETFHVRCLRKILYVHWQDKIPNTEILEKVERSNCTSIQTLLMCQKRRWAGHVCCIWRTTGFQSTGVVEILDLGERFLKHLQRSQYQERPLHTAKGRAGMDAGGVAPSRLTGPGVLPGKF